GPSARPTPAPLPLRPPPGTGCTCPRAPASAPAPVAPPPGPAGAAAVVPVMPPPSTPARTSAVSSLLLRFPLQHLALRPDPLARQRKPLLQLRHPLPVPLLLHLQLVHHHP